MDYAAEHFHPVSLEQVAAALDGGPRLPSRPLLVTFDDGYRDNLTAALPVLRERGIPMTVFLATGLRGRRAPFPWDLAAWCFRHTAALRGRPAGGGGAVLGHGRQSGRRCSGPGWRPSSAVPRRRGRRRSPPCPRAWG